MKALIFVVILIITPHLAWGDANTHKKKKKVHHHKVDSHRKHERYKAVTYYNKNGQKRHKYIDTEAPKQEAAVAATNLPAIKYIDSSKNDLGGREPSSRDVMNSQVKAADPQIESELDAKIPN